MKKYRPIVAVFCLCLLASLLSTGALAMEGSPVIPEAAGIIEETLLAVSLAEEESDTVTADVFHVNPLYEDAAAEEVFLETAATAAMPLSETPVFTEEDYEDLVLYWREIAKYRVASICFSYTTDDYDGEQIRSDAAYKKQAVNSLLKNLWNDVLAHTGVPDEGDYLRWHYWTWGTTEENKISISIGENSVTFTIPLVLTYYTTYDQEVELEDGVTEVLNSLNLEEKSDYEKVLAIYDFICGHVDYDYTQAANMLKHTAYSALINGKAVCQGYASLFYNMALRCGIDTRLIPGDAVSSAGNKERHGWNIVCMDGVYYCLDATWDANREPGEYAHFLRGAADFTEKHIPDEDYSSDAFYARYPVSETNYSGVIGDVNENGVLSSTDLVLLMKIVAGAEAASESAVTNLNEDEVTDILDVIRLVRLLAEAA